MKKTFSIFLFLIGATAALFAGGKQDTAKRAETVLDPLIDGAAAAIVDSLAPGTRIAIVTFETSSPKLREFVIDELTGKLVKAQKFTPVARGKILEVIQKEQDFQYSGAVSDESMVSLGRLLGAQSVVSGSIRKVGNFWAFRVRALDVETGKIQAEYSERISGETDLFAMVGDTYSAGPAGSITIESEVPGTVLIDGIETEVTVKAQGSTPAISLATGRTTIAVRTNDGQVYPAAQDTLVRNGQTETVSIRAGALWDIKKTGEGAVVVGYRGGPGKKVEIPAVIDGLPVVGIESVEAWKSSIFDGKEITGVVIPYGVTRIGERTFYGCSGLTSVTIPNSVTRIEGWAFFNCSGLISVTIPNSVTSIGEYAFYGCSGLTSVTIPNRVTRIGNYAFRGCSGLTSITIPNSVTSIGADAFAHCSGLTSVTIPNSVTSISGNPFPACANLLSINVSSGNPAYSSRDGILFDKNGSTLQGFPGKRTGSYSIPNSVTSIGSEAFSNCSGLTSVTIPNSVTSIGDNAFVGCSGLTSITIPDSVTSIVIDAFAYCSGLKSVTIPNSVTAIDSWVFEGCSGLTSITIPNSVDFIGQSAFEGCSGLTSVTIPNSVTSIDKRAFYNCSGLTSVTIPNSVTSIGDNAFWGCSGLTSITIPDSVTSIDRSAFSGCSGLTSITIPGSVTSIGDYAFRDCSGFTSITIPGSVTSIGRWAFAYCWELSSITIPANVSIENDSFDNDFDAFYTANGKKAGTYTYNGKNWTYKKAKR